ncbi:Acyltransferase [Aphelenchoides fujianensis]|nr:Acyltransferase [Aphelenchoides fujianensis]
MRLESRVCEFMAGFFAHQSAVEKKEWNGRQSSVVRPLVFFFLVVLLLVPLTSSPQIQRLLVVLTTSILLAARPSPSTFPGAEWIVRLGDCSYGVYLVHWPLITFWRMAAGREGGEWLDPFVGVGLLVLSIADGWLVEEGCKRAVRRVDTWTRLLLLVGVLYLTAFSALLLLHQNQQEMRDLNGRSPQAQAVRIAETRMLWRKRHERPPFTPERTAELNKRISFLHETCARPTRRLPSTIVRDLTAVDKMYMSFFGIVEHFRPIARTITLISTPACTPVPLSFQQADLSAVGKWRCVKFIRTGLQLLQTWEDGEIDVIITLFGYLNFKEDIPLRTNDPILKEMRIFYAALAPIPREVLFVSGVNLFLPFNPLRLLLDAFHSNRPVGPLQTTRAEQEAIVPSVRQRLRSIACPSCVYVEWLDLWCGRGPAGVCEAVENEWSIARFQDTHHVTTYGSLYVGEFLLDKYRQFLRKKGK